MPTTQQVLALVRAGRSYEEIGAQLGVPPGQAYMIATGLPADGGDTLAPEDRRREGLLTPTSQHLVNPTAVNPTVNEEALAWVKRRAGGDRQMRSAADRRDAVPPEIADPDDFGDVAVVLTRDHNQVRSLLEQLNALPSYTKGGTAAHMARRKSIVDMITYRLSQHETVEEEHFWPAVRRVLADGDERADTALEQENEGQNTLTALAKLDGDNEEFDTLVERLTLQLHKHVAFEERVFLDLAAAMADDDRDQLGRTLRDAESQAPTRPHPQAPQGGPAVRAAAPGAAAVDRARDAEGRRPAERRGQAESEQHPREGVDPGT